MFDEAEIKKIRNNNSNLRLGQNIFSLNILRSILSRSTSAVLAIAMLGSFLVPHLSNADEIIPVITAPVVQAELQHTETPQKPTLVQIQGGLPAPFFNAKSVLIYDSETGSNFYAKNVGEQLPIASLTKLMTAIVASESPQFNKPITITKEDQVSIAPYLHLQINDSVYPADLVKSMLVGSANDAALAIANHFPEKNQFISIMNQKAQNLGMYDTHFSTPIGFDTPGNYSTAADLKILVNYALNHLPYPQIWQGKNYSFTSQGGRRYYINNSNNLVYSHSNILSIKTGNTEQALGNMIVLARDDSGRAVITLVLGSNQRETDTLTAIDYAFKSAIWSN